jgi:outer membrane protein TolC
MRHFVGFVVFLALLGGGVPLMRAQTPSALTVDDVIEQVREANVSILNAARETQEAFANRTLTRAGVLPDVALTVRPYSYDARRIPTNPPATAAQTSQGVGAGLSVTQPLPTSGVLSASLDHDVTIVERDGTRIDQAPVLGFNFNQPLFVNGAIVSTAPFQASLRSADIGYERAQQADTLTRNGAIQGALSQYVQVVSLRRSITVLERTIGVLRQQLQSAELDRQQGLISDNAVLALQVTLNNRRETLFDTQLALVNAEQALSRSLGLPSLADTVLADNFPEPALPSLADDTAALLVDNPEIALSELAVDQVRQAALLNELTDRPTLSASVRLAPVYPDVRDEPNDFAASVSDLFGDGSSVETTVALSLTVPLLTARERRAREQIDTLSQERAIATRDDTRLGVSNALDTLRANRRFLEERAELIDVDLAFEEQRVANERALLDAGVSTELRLEEVELDLFARQNERWQIDANLFLNTVQIYAVLGYQLDEVLLGAE